jgi:hypothetical protein
MEITGLKCASIAGPAGAAVIPRKCSADSAELGDAYRPDNPVVNA